jgi:hypothetical protein
MSEPLTFALWETVRRLAEPDELMRFTLIFDGSLPPSAPKRATYAARIRNDLHVQLRDLWENHVLMRQLRHEARGYPDRVSDLALDMRGPLPDYQDNPPPLRPGQIDLCAPISVLGAPATYLPIVRKSLHLACAIDILFLRHEEPGRLFEGGGDIDNRLKCFFDALTVPNIEQARKGEEPIANPLCCLLEDDVLISDFSVRTGRLLGKTTKSQYDVRLQAEITIKILRSFYANEHLLGG